MKFIAEKEFDRWHCGPYVIAKYDDGFYAYRYFKYKMGGRDAKRLHGEDKPLPSFKEAVALCVKVSNQLFLLQKDCSTTKEPERQPVMKRSKVGG